VSNFCWTNTWDFFENYKIKLVEEMDNIIGINIALLLYSGLLKQCMSVDCQVGMNYTGWLSMLILKSCEKSFVQMLRWQDRWWRRYIGRHTGSFSVPSDPYGKKN